MRATSISIHFETSAQSCFILSVPPPIIDRIENAIPPPPPKKNRAPMFLSMMPFQVSCRDLRIHRGLPPHPVSFPNPSHLITSHSINSSSFLLRPISPYAPLLPLINPTTTPTATNTPTTTNAATHCRPDHDLPLPYPHPLPIYTPPPPPYQSRFPLSARRSSSSEASWA